jgi:hypothetical protein
MREEVLHSEVQTPPRVHACAEINDFAKVHRTLASQGGADDDRF